MHYVSAETASVRDPAHQASTAEKPVRGERGLDVTSDLEIKPESLLSPGFIINLSFISMSSQLHELPL